jgi:hypothetical protein
MSVATKGVTDKPDVNVDEILKQAQPNKSGRFKSVLGAIGRGALNMVFPGLGGALGGGLSSQLLGSAIPGIGSEASQYLALQRQLQQEQIAFETVSTVLKIRSDVSMSAVRNFKTG